MEYGFSVVTNLLIKNTNQFQMVNCHDLLLLLMKIEQKITKLVASHQVHPTQCDDFERFNSFYIAFYSELNKVS